MLGCWIAGGSRGAAVGRRTNRWAASKPSAGGTGEGPGLTGEAIRKPVLTGGGDQRPAGTRGARPPPGQPTFGGKTGGKGINKKLIIKVAQSASRREKRKGKESPSGAPPRSRFKRSPLKTAALPPTPRRCALRRKVAMTAVFEARRYVHRHDEPWWGYGRQPGPAGRGPGVGRKPGSCRRLLARNP